MTQHKRATSPSAQYFAEILRLLRTSAGLFQNDLGARMNYTGGAVSAAETGAKPATDEFVEAAEKALDAGGVIRAASKYLRLERYPEYFQGFVRLEQEALSVMSWCTQVIHGLLQTEAYARELFRSGFPPADEAEIEQLVTARLERAVRLERRPVCVVDIVLDEAALRRRLGSPEVMKEQYDALASFAGRSNVTLQVMPGQRGSHAGLYGPMTLMETPDDERLVYMEGNGKSTLVSKPDEVGVLARRCAMIRSQALRPEESLSLIEELAEEL
jgi:transcriptional regulator with XRE-family HTH domain